MKPNQYTPHAILVDTVGEAMLKRLDIFTISPQVIVDLGCGTGKLTNRLAELYPEANTTGIDIDPEIFPENDRHFFPAAAEKMPIKTASVDFIFSNLLFPFCEDADLLLQECRRVLKPHGLLFFSTFGPDTFQGLIEKPIFPDMHDVGDALVNSGFIDPVMEMQNFQLNYSSEKNLQEEFKVLALDQFLQFPLNVAGACEVEFEVVYGHAWRQEVDGFAMNDDGEVSVPLHWIKGRL